ncbi:hypothetical protein Tco_0958797 [Tanacetum coccineum]
MVAYLQKPEGSEAFHQIMDFLNSSHIKYALIENPKIYISLIQQLWGTTTARTTNDGEVEIIASIDGQVKTITKASLRRHLKLEDSNGITSLPNIEIFEQLALMGYVSDSARLTFQKGYFSPQWRFFIHTILHYLSPKTTTWEQFSSNIATAIICLATNRTFNFSKLIFDAIVKNLDSTHKFSMYPRFLQICLNKQKRLLQPHTRTYPTPTLTEKLFSNMKRVSKADEATFISVDVDAGGAAPIDIGLDAGQGSGTIHKTPIRPHDLPLPRVHTLGSDEGSLQQNELMDLVTKLTDRVEVLENDMQQTKKVYSSALTKLILIVKKLEKKVKTTKARRRARIVISEDEDAKEDSSKQGRKISEIDKDPTISLINKEERQRIARDAEIAKQLQEEFDRARQEQEVVAEADQAHHIDWSDPVVLRYHAVQNRSFSKAEVRKNIADGSSKNYKVFNEMLDDFDRQDVMDLYRLVQERYDTTSPEGYDLLLWGDLKILFESNKDDEIWKNQQDYNLISWRLFDSCGIHMLLMHTGIAIHMMIEKKYPLTQEMLSRMLSRRLEVDQESEMAFELLMFIRSQLQK